MLIFSPVYRLSWVRHTFQLQYRLSTPFPYVARKPRGAENLTRHIVPYRPLSLTHSPLFDRALRRRPASDDFAHTTKGPRYVSTSHIYAARATRPPHPSPARIPTAPKDHGTPRQLLSLSNYPPTFVRLWSKCVPAIQALLPEHQHDLTRMICNQALLRRPPPVIVRLAADLRSVAIEIGQHCSLQDRYANDLQAALDAGEPRSGTTTKASFVPRHCTLPRPGPQ